MRHMGGEGRMIGGTNGMIKRRGIMCVDEERKGGG